MAKRPIKREKAGEVGMYDLEVVCPACHKKILALQQHVTGMGVRCPHCEAVVRASVAELSSVITGATKRGGGERRFSRRAIATVGGILIALPLLAVVYFVNVPGAAYVESNGGGTPPTKRVGVRQKDAQEVLPQQTHEERQVRARIEEPLSAAQIYKRIVSSVVVIRSFRKINALNSQGSGFVVRFGDSEPMIATNEHVVRGAHRLVIKTHDEKTATINSVLVVDSDRDITLLPLPHELRNLQTIPIAESLPPIGETVFAIGAPQGFEFSITSGIVSQIRESVPNYGTMIQMDASISPGSSGGPLVDSHGEVVGVNTLGSRATANANNLNFAVALADIQALYRKTNERPLTELTGYRELVASIELMRKRDREQQGLAGGAPSPTTTSTTNSTVVSRDKKNVDREESQRVAEISQRVIREWSSMPESAQWNRMRKGISTRIVDERLGKNKDFKILSRGTAYVYHYEVEGIQLEGWVYFARRSRQVFPYRPPVVIGWTHPLAKIEADVAKTLMSR